MVSPSNPVYLLRISSRVNYRHSGDSYSEKEKAPSRRLLTQYSIAYFFDDFFAGTFLALGAEALAAPAPISKFSAVTPCFLMAAANQRG